MRNKYDISDMVIWCDLVYLLDKLGKDLRNPHFVCPPDLKTAHDRYMEKQQVILEREREQQRILQEAERLERERKKLEDMEKDKENYIRKKAVFLQSRTDRRIARHQSVTECGRIFRKKGKPCTIASIPTNIIIRTTH